MSAVCTSANERNICCNSGRFTNFESRAFDRRDDPSGLISMVCTTSPKEAAHASKWLMPRSSSNAGARYRFNVYISPPARRRRRSSVRTGCGGRMPALFAGGLRSDSNPTSSNRAGNTGSTPIGKTQEADVPASPYIVRPFARLGIGLNGQRARKILSLSRMRPFMRLQMLAYQNSRLLQTFADHVASMA